MSPTQRALAELKRDGWLAGVVEHWNPHARIRQDLFGIIDVLAVRGIQTLALQVTSGSNMAARMKKLTGSKAANRVIYAGWILEVWAYRKNARGRYVKRTGVIEYVSD